MSAGVLSLIGYRNTHQDFKKIAIFFKRADEPEGCFTLKGSAVHPCPKIINPPARKTLYTWSI
jgi:hypothetical protein